MTDLEHGTNGGRVAQEPYSFAGVAPQEIDECVAVTDSMAGNLGTVCGKDAPKTFTYTRTIGGYTECGEFEVDNTASFLTNDTGATGSDGAGVDVTVPCEPPANGCTRTIGYWKTHAGFGPQADAVTPLLPILLGSAGGAMTLNAYGGVRGPAARDGGLERRQGLVQRDQQAVRPVAGYEAER